MGFFYAMKTRTQLELWEVVKTNFDKHFIYGLCHVIKQMKIYKEINYHEWKRLIKELMNFGDTDNDYFLGERKDPKPRLEFIEKMIKKHEQLD